MSNVRKPPLTRVRTGAVPMGWHHILVLDLDDDGDYVSAVIEIDTHAGWLRRFVTDEAGRAILDRRGIAQVERRQGRFAIIGLQD